MHESCGGDRDVRMVRIRTCADTCTDMCKDMCTDMCVDMYIDMCVDTCIDTCVDMCVDICTDMCHLLNVGLLRQDLVYEFDVGLGVVCPP